MAKKAYEPSEMADLDLKSLEDEKLPDGHKSGFVAVAGRPNVGKSTLMNAFLDQKVAIVSARPQTTRHKQLGILTTPEYQIIFVDTPGLIKPRHELDEYMVTVAQESVRDADIILWLVDAGEPPGFGDKAIAETFRDLPVEQIVILAINKADLVELESVITRTEEYRELLPHAPWLLFSALEGRGLDALLAILIDALPEGPRFYPIDQTTDSFVRDVAAELIREQIFIQMRDELPYGTTVVVEQFKKRDDGVTYINATIYVERKSHKKIIIGTKGSQLRSIGTSARLEIEKLVEGKVFLDQWVKVEPNWRKNAKALKRLGFGS